MRNARDATRPEPKLRALQASAELCTEDSPQQGAAPTQDQRRFRVQVIQSIEDVRAASPLDDVPPWRLSQKVYF